MDLTAHLRNWQYGFRVCPRTRDAARLGCFHYARHPWLLRLATRGDFRFRLPPPVGELELQVRNGSDFLVFHEIFERRVYAIDYPFTPSTILDLGANVGYSSLFLQRTFPNAQLAALEPVATNATALRHNWALNGVRGIFFEAAAAPFDGTLEMELSIDDCGHRVVGSDSSHEHGAAHVRVEAMSIPTLLQRLGWQSVDLLKVDIEGYESVLLRQDASWLGLVRMVFIEVHGDFGEPELREVAALAGFTQLRQVDPNVWTLTR